jgi:tetratricopeptide (TPR) repeat protein
LDLQRRGLIEPAREIYQQVLRRDPWKVHALHGSGRIALQTGLPALAVEMHSRALALQPSAAALYNNLARCAQDFWTLQ